MDAMNTEEPVVFSVLPPAPFEFPFLVTTGIHLRVSHLEGKEQPPLEMSAHPAAAAPLSVFGKEPASSKHGEHHHHHHHEHKKKKKKHKRKHKHKHRRDGRERGRAPPAFPSPAGGRPARSPSLSD